MTKLRYTFQGALYNSGECLYNLARGQAKGGWTTYFIKMGSPASSSDPVHLWCDNASRIIRSSKKRTVVTMHIYDLIIADKETTQLEDIFLPDEKRKAIEQLIKEHYYVEELQQYGLPVNNKIMLHGASGCGKTTTAKAIANALGKPLFILNLSNIICARIGETSQNIKAVFDKAAREKAVLFLDEFDQIGKARGDDQQDVGEMRRLVNTLIQLIDYFPEKALLIGATNHVHIIDHALLRRFQLNLSFEMPDAPVLNNYYDMLLVRFPEHMRQVQRKMNISFAEAKDDVLTQVKTNLIAHLEATTKNVNT